MVTITAVIRVRREDAEAMAAALLDVAAYVEATEPGTLAFHICRSMEDPCVFTTFERFTDRAAMDAHNGSPAVARFFAAASPTLDGPVILHTCSELAAVVGPPG